MGEEMIVALYIHLFCQSLVLFSEFGLLPHLGALAASSRSQEASSMISHTIDYFYQITCKVLFISLLHRKAKFYFYNYVYYYVVGDGTMICTDGGGSISTSNIFK
jgi:hypothetical protein